MWMVGYCHGLSVVCWLHGIWFGPGMYMYMVCDGHGLGVVWYGRSLGVVWHGRSLGVVCTCTCHVMDMVWAWYGMWA